MGRWGVLGVVTSLALAVGVVGAGLAAERQVVARLAVGAVALWAVSGPSPGPAAIAAVGLVRGGTDGVVSVDG